MIPVIYHVLESTLDNLVQFINKVARHNMYKVVRLNMTGVLSRPTLVKQKVGMRGAYISHCPNLDMISLIKSIANGYINGYTYTPYTPIYTVPSPTRLLGFFFFLLILLYSRRGSGAAPRGRGVGPV